MPLNKKKLTPKELERVHDWLHKHQINPAKVRREFSDVLPLAELLKPTYPKLIDLYNYPSKNGIQLKLINWQTFNTKVLAKLGFVLGRDFMLSLASGDCGAIEVLLHELIKVECKAQRAELKAAEAKQEQVWRDNDEIKTIVVNKQIGDGIVQMPQKMILYSLYEKLQRECIAKDNLIDSTRLKIEHMANIIDIKSQRIEELILQIGKMSLKAGGTDNATVVGGDVQHPKIAAATGSDGPTAPPPTESPHISNDSLNAINTLSYDKFPNRMK